MNIKNIYAVLFVVSVLFISTLTTNAQNKFEEVLSFKEINGYMVIHARVGGTEGDFLLDAQGKVFLTQEAANARKIEIETLSEPKTGRFNTQLLGNGYAQGFFFGENMYSRDINVTVLKTNTFFKQIGC